MLKTSVLISWRAERPFDDTGSFPSLLSGLQWEEEGKKEGIEEGIEKGIEKGIELGKLQGIKKVVKSMLDKNMDIKDIVDITGLSEEEILSLKWVFLFYLLLAKFIFNCYNYYNVEDDWYEI